MITKIQRWGNSLAVRIPRTFARDLGIESGGEVELDLAEGRMTLAPHLRRRYRLSDLLGRITRANLHAGVDTGARRGREVL